MIRAMWNSRSGMQAMQEKLDSVSNNLSNSQTTGYKKVDVKFSDLIYEQLERNGYPTNNNGTKEHLTGSGVRATDWIRNNTQGILIPTNIPSDLAIEGEGYFRVTTTDGNTAYTRDGSFLIDSNGDLVTANGDRLETNITDNNVKLKSGDFSIDADGYISIMENQVSRNVGKINLYKPVGQDSMNSTGNNIFTLKQGAQMELTNDSVIRQGLLEGSNVDVAAEITDMIVAQRAFELNSKGLTTADQMMGIINNLRSK